MKMEEATEPVICTLLHESEAKRGDFKHYVYDKLGISTKPAAASDSCSAENNSDSDIVVSWNYCPDGETFESSTEGRGVEPGANNNTMVPTEDQESTGGLVETVARDLMTNARFRDTTVVTSCSEDMVRTPFKIF